jgi:hypothetical protein
MRVIVRPINKHKMLNIVKYKNCYDYLGPYYTRSGNIYTGLSIAEAQRLGTILGVNLSPASSYWSTFFVRLGADDVYLDTEDPLDELKYLFLKNNKRVKTSMFEHKATADYLLINKDEEAKRENLFNKVKVDAVSEFKKMSLTDMRKCLRLFGHNAENSSGELVENTMFKIVESNPSMFLEKWVNNSSRELEVVLEQAIARNIIRRNKNIYKFGSDVIGYSIQETMDFLNNPKNQDIKISILNSIEAKDFIVANEAPEEEVKKHVDLMATDEKKPVPDKVKKPKIVSGAPDSDEEGIDISKLDFIDPN